MVFLGTSYFFFLKSAVQLKFAMPKHIRYVCLQKHPTLQGAPLLSLCHAGRGRMVQRVQNGVRAYRRTPRIP